MTDVRFEKLKKILEDEKGCKSAYELSAVRRYSNDTGNIFDYYYTFLRGKSYPSWLKFKEDLKKDYFMTKERKWSVPQEVLDLEELFRFVDEI